MSAHILPHVVAQHAEEAAALWEQRGVQWDLPHIRLKDIVEHDMRIEAHVDGLRIAGEAAWPILRAGGFADSGQVFVAALLALESNKSDLIREIIRLGCSGRQQRRGLAGALAWCPGQIATRFVLPLISSEKPGERWVGLAVNLAHRHYSKEPLARAINDSHFSIRSMALRGVGELGACDLLAAARARLSDEDPRCKYAAAWTLALRAGDAKAIDHLLEVALTRRPESREAFHVAVRRMDPAAAGRWLSTLAAVPETSRLALRGLGLIGDPRAIPQLIEHMSDPNLARVAGEAFTLITGVDLAEQYLNLETEPARPEPGDEELVDPDEDLPWPDSAKVKAWWDKHRRESVAGTRQMLGKPMTPDWLRTVWKDGKQRQRVAAALELAIRESSKPLLNLTAPGYRQ
jgi:uncharacterized protein (TIGR02270 family)